MMWDGKISRLEKGGRVFLLRRGYENKNNVEKKEKEREREREKGRRRENS
jgi:hypothetical protein